MKVESITKLVNQRTKDLARIAELQATIAEEVKVRKERVAKIEARLSSVINKSGDEGTMQNLKAGDVMVYASESDKYSIPKDSRGELNDWVLEGLQEVAAENPDYVELEDVISEIYDRLEIFTNKVNKDPIVEFRKKTGGKEVEGDLRGGKLPGGVKYYLEQKVNFRKA
jgi:uncharacterized membrane protein YheB (UPF0754 family)